MADVGRLSTLAGWAIDLFSLASDAAGDVRDHESGIETGVGRQKWRQPRHAGINQHCDAALGDGADFGDGDGHRVAGKATGSAWKLPPEIICCVSPNTSGLSVTALASRSNDQRRVAQLVEAGAHHLRLAAQAVRVLHAIVVFFVRMADFAAGQQGAIVTRDVDLTWLTTHRVNARIKRAIALPRARRP